MSPEMQKKNTGRGDQEFDFGHDKFEMSIRHPSRVAE